MDSQGQIDQRSIDAIPKKVWDVIIVGAGPAGSIAAIHLASHGHQVLLLEKHRFPREKVCGDGLIADSQKCLQRVGLLKKVSAAGHTMDMVTVFSPSRISFSISGQCVTLRRIVLDALLAQEAVRMGAMFGHGNVGDVRVGDDGLVCCDVDVSNVV